MPRKISYVDMWWDVLDAGIWVSKDGTLYPVISMDDKFLFKVAKIIIAIAVMQHASRKPEDRDKQVVDYVTENPLWKHLKAEADKRGLIEEFKAISVYRTEGV